jgi:hypothetical protein
MSAIHAFIGRHRVAEHKPKRGLGTPEALSRITAEYASLPKAAVGLESMAAMPGTGSYGVQS